MQGFPYFFHSTEITILLQFINKFDPTHLCNRNLYRTLILTTEKSLRKKRKKLPKI